MNFTAPWWLPGPHAQTIYGSLFARAPRVPFREDAWKTPDGDRVRVDFVDGPQGKPWVHLYHGLEGSSESPYARVLMHHVRARGWRGSVFHFRGCGGKPNLLPRAYHSGDSEEIDWSLREIRRLAGKAPVYAVGVSLGGNALAKWLGERGAAAGEVVDAAAAVSAPVDLNFAGPAMSRGLTRLYGWVFLHTLKPSTMLKLERFPELQQRIDACAVSLASTLRDFDDAVTAPLHGFRDALDYWEKASAKPHLKGVRVRTLLVNARDDPFMPGDRLPEEHEVSDAVKLEFTAHGGHVGFVAGPFPGHIEWLPVRLLQFFEHRQ